MVGLFNLLAFVMWVFVGLYVLKDRNKRKR
jgi:hypothetical protein